MNEKYLLISGRSSAAKTELLIAYANLYPKNTIILSCEDIRLKERGLDPNVTVVDIEKLDNIDFSTCNTFCIDYVELFDNFFINDWIKKLMNMDIRIIAISQMEVGNFSVKNNVFEQIATKDSATNVLEYATVKIKLPFEVKDKNSIFVCSSKGNILYKTPNEKDEMLAKKICNHVYEALQNWERDGIGLSFHKNENTLYNVAIDKLLCEGADTDYPSIELYVDNKKINLPEMSLHTYMKYPIFYNEGTTIVASGDLIYFDADRMDKKFDLRECHNKLLKTKED